MYGKSTKKHCRAHPRPASKPFLKTLAALVRRLSFDSESAVWRTLSAASGSAFCSPLSFAGSSTTLPSGQGRTYRVCQVCTGIPGEDGNAAAVATPLPIRPFSGPHSHTTGGPRSHALEGPDEYIFACRPHRSSHHSLIHPNCSVATCWLRVRKA